MKDICKAQRIKERQLRNGERKWRKPRKPLKPVTFRVDPEDELVLILRNGKRLRQASGVDLFVSKLGEVYSLTQYGLRRMRVNYTRRRHYGEKSCNGVNIGRRYPYVIFRGKTYRIHILMANIYLRPLKDGEEVDHINGDIDDFSLDNLEIVTREENHFRGRVLRALRKAAEDYHLPYMDPIQRTPEDMLATFERFKKLGFKKALALEIERQKVFHALVKASRELNDPSLDPRRMCHEHREEILAKYRVVDPAKIMEYEMTHHMEC